MADRILLVDDEPAILSAIWRQLDKAGFDITACGNPAEALAAINREEFAVIVSDNLMPGGSGLDLLSAARDRWPLTRRVLLTGATDLEDAVSAFNTGTIHRFINKPWQREDLIQALKKEAGIYRTERTARGEQARLEATAKAGSVKLQETIDELKQSRTQVALFEDMAHLDEINVPPGVAGLHVWVVDDNDEVRDLLVMSLQKAGLKHCLGIPSAVDALGRTQGKPDVQLILSEWKMEPIDGLAFLNRLRSEGSTAASAKFVLLTGREQRPLVEHALKAGVDGYIIKPFRLQKLLDQIDQLLSKDAERQDRRQKQLADLTCLVVNQHGASCDQINDLLSAAGVKGLYTARWWATALRQLNERRIDVLVYDLNVKEPGWQQLRQELSKLPRPPALLLTSVLPTQDELDQMRRAGISNFLPGPFRQAKLIESVVKAAGLQPAEPLGGAPQPAGMAE
jgi:DNA-binding NtrC family response regulator